MSVHGSIHKVNVKDLEHKVVCTSLVYAYQNSCVFEEAKVLTKVKIDLTPQNCTKTYYSTWTYCNCNLLHLTR